jgi:hypothetical protein
MRSPCSLSLYPNLVFVRGLMISPYCLRVHLPPPYFFVFYADRFVSMENRRLVLPRTSRLVLQFVRVIVNDTYKYC